MRIIAGEFRHRKLHTPPDASITRPIPDRVKESLFSLLRGWTEGATVLDAFAGTGAIGLECLSRGAERCVFVERDKRIIDLLRRNVEDLGCDDRAEVVQGDALGAALLSRCPRPVDLVFFDPPYPLVWDPPADMGGEGGWDRVKRQFARVVELLNTSAGGGYAVLRTPWPFRHRPVVEGEMSEDPRRAAHRSDPSRHSRPPATGTKQARQDRRRDDSEIDEERAWEGEELADLLAAGPEHLHAQTHDDPNEDLNDDAREALLNGDSAANAVPVDLTIPGAVGPETHVYGNTAIHLYMKQKDATQPTG